MDNFRFLFSIFETQRVDVQLKFIRIARSGLIDFNRKYSSKMFVIDFVVQRCNGLQLILVNSLQILCKFPPL